MPSERRRLADRAAGVRADGQRHVVRRDRRRRAAAASRPGTRSRSHGLAVGPNAESSVDEPIANSSMFVLPGSTAPAALSRSAMWASYGPT